MTDRVTTADLERIVARINRMTNSPLETYTMVDGKYRSNKGNFHLSQQYGGCALHRIANEQGGTSDVLRIGHVSKRALRDAMFAMISGMEIAEGAK
jgi:hypothetical protein